MGLGVFVMVFSFFPDFSHRIPKSISEVKLETEGLRDRAQGAEEATANSLPCTEPDCLPICVVQSPPSKEVSVDPSESHGEAERIKIRAKLSAGSLAPHCDTPTV